MGELQTLSPTHEMVLNWIICNPDRNLRECADHFGYTQSWLSCIIHSDIFQHELARRQENVRTAITQSIPEKLRRAGDIAVEKLTTHLESSEDPEFILSAADKILHRLGYAPQSSRAPQGGAGVSLTQTNVYMASPADLASARELMGRVGETMGLPVPKGDPPLEGEFLPAASLGSQGEPSFSRELPPIEGELLP